MDRERFLDFLSRMETMKEVIKLNDLTKYHELIKKDRYWSPETRLAKYSEWVMENYEFDPNDALTLCIYSLLMNVPIREVMQKMNDGFELELKKRQI